ncbi:phage tail protein [Pseudomonas sp. USHLN015]|uniref:phage tail protein n=1 Tax=Pseudomonas sp. USHLN015 TaxID=3081296 RepID=UPI00301D02FE
MKVIEGLHVYGDELRIPSPSECHSWQDGEWVLDDALVVAAKERRLSKLCEAIDRAGNSVLESLVGSPLRLVEYEVAATEARAFKLAGYPIDAVPRSVSAWSIGGRHPEQAANEIIAKAQRSEVAIHALREIRLVCKSKVRQAMADGREDEARLHVKQAIEDMARL